MNSSLGCKYGRGSVACPCQVRQERSCRRDQRRQQYQGRHQPQGGMMWDGVSSPQFLTSDIRMACGGCLVTGVDLFAEVGGIREVELDVLVSNRERTCPLLFDDPLTSWKSPTTQSDRGCTHLRSQPRLRDRRKVGIDRSLGASCVNGADFSEVSTLRVRWDPLTASWRCRRGFDD